MILMPVRRRRAVLTIPVLVLATVAAATVAARVGRTDGSSPSPAGDGEAAPAADTTTTSTRPPPPRAVGALALRQRDAAALDPARYRVVILNAWEHARAAAIKAVNPDATVLVYKDMASTRSYPSADGRGDDLLPTGVGYAAADREHADWFLLDQRGRRIEWDGYPDHWWMDVGNEAYATQWTEAVASEVAANGWDGVFIDNAMTSTAFYRPQGVTIPRYDDEAYQAATEAFLQRAAARVRSEGRVVVANMGGRTPDVDVVGRWAAITGGVMREHFGRWGSDGAGEVIAGDAWQHQLEQQDAANATGATYVAVSYAHLGDAAFLTYARASFLVGWDGTGDALIVTSPDAGMDPFRPAWTADVGVPVEPRVAVEGAWRRRYSEGVVVVNPSDRAVRVALGGAYLVDGGAEVEVVLVEPQQGVVLRTATPTTENRTG